MDSINQLLSKILGRMFVILLLVAAALCFNGMSLLDPHSVNSLSSSYLQTLNIVIAVLFVLNVGAVWSAKNRLGELLTKAADNSAIGRLWDAIHRMKGDKATVAAEQFDAIGKRIDHLNDYYYGQINRLCNDLVPAVKMVLEEELTDRERRKGIDLTKPEPDADQRSTNGVDLT